jgi:hypothetical protein
VTVTRLSGGLTPEDGSDPRTFPAIFNAAADLIEANESDIDDLELKNIPTFGTAVPADGDALVYDDALGVYNPGPGGGLPSNAFAFVETVYFTSNGTFTKADYPWLRAIRVKCQGGGGGGGRAVATSSSTVSAGDGGGGGGYAESFITNIASLDASVTVTLTPKGLLILLMESFTVAAEVAHSLQAPVAQLEVLALTVSSSWTCTHKEK